MFSFGFTKDDLKRVAWTAIQAGIAAFWAAVSGVGAIKDLSTAKAALIAGIVAAAAGLLSALKNAVLAEGAKIK